MGSHGTSLLEVLIAVAILCAATLGIAQLLAAAAASTAMARTQTLSAALAAARLEQLRALVFAFDAEGQRIADTSANVSTDPAGRDGNGLGASPAGALAGDEAGFVDYLGMHGQWVGGGSSPPVEAVFVRRWSIEPLGPDALILQVAVRPLAGDRRGDAARRVRGESRFVTVIPREAR